MPSPAGITHRDRILNVLSRKGIARLTEFLKAGEPPPDRVAPSDVQPQLGHVPLDMAVGPD